jgi:UDP-N-acetyl-D-mannosaminuronic acid dehydrogenase
VPSVLHLKPTDVDTDEKRSKYSVAVVGCGHKGIFYANAFADAGFNVLCTDSDASVVKKAARGKTAFAMPEAQAKLKSHIATEKIDVTSELKKAVAKSDIVVVAITAKIDEQKNNDCTGVANICKQIGAAIHSGVLVIYGGIAGLNFMEGTLKEALENASGLQTGKDFALTYSPILNTAVAPANLELKIAATDEVSLKAATTILTTITKKVKEVSDLRTAEAAALFAVAKQDTTTALANELAVFCENANIDYFKVLEALNLNSTEFYPTIAEEENKNQAYLLMDAAECINTKLRLTALARQINEDIVRHAANLTIEGLKRCGKSVRRSKVAVLGPVIADSGSGLFVKMLEQKGAKITQYNPSAKKENTEAGDVKSSLNEAVEGADCIVLLIRSQQYNHVNLKKLKALVKSPAAVVDLVGKFDPAQVDTEGFKYTGLGKGTDQK